MSSDNEKIEITWFGHSCFRFEIGNQRFYFDPVRKNKLLGTTLELAKEKNISRIFISHEHWDHYDAETIISLSSPETTVYCPIPVATVFSCRLSFEADDMNSFQRFAKTLYPVRTNDVIDFDAVSIHCLEATEGISYLIKSNQKKILFMGDSIATERMIEEKPDVILFPIWAVRGEDADLASFTKLAGENICIPMHYHTNPYGLPNFYTDILKIQELLKDVNLKILEKDKTYEF